MGDKLDCEKIPIDINCYCKDKDKYNSNKTKYGLTDYDINRMNSYCSLNIYNFGDDDYCKNQVAGNLDFNCYCKYPDAYKNSTFGLTQKQVNNMDEYCVNINRVRPPENTIWGDISKMDPKSLVRDSWDKVSILVTNICTEDGLKEMAKMLVGIELSKIALKVGVKMLSKKFLMKYIELGQNYFPQIFDTMETLGGDALEEITMDVFINGIMATAITSMVDTVSTAMSLLAVMIGFATTIIGIVVDVALVVWDVLMLSGMVLDMIDPYGYNQELDGEQLYDISSKFNQVFISTMFNQVNFPEGNTWPIEYFADFKLLNEFKFTNTDDFDVLKMVYTTQYLNSLIFNSRGEYIYLPGESFSPKNKDSGMALIQKYNLDTNISRINSTVLKTLGNGNLVVISFIQKNWFVISLVIIIIVIILILLK